MFIDSRSGFGVGGFYDVPRYNTPNEHVLIHIDNDDLLEKAASPLIAKDIPPKDAINIAEEDDDELPHDEIVIAVDIHENADNARVDPDIGDVPPGEAAPEDLSRGWAEGRLRETMEERTE